MHSEIVVIITVNYSDTNKNQLYMHKKLHLILFPRSDREYWCNLSLSPPSARIVTVLNSFSSDARAPHFEFRQNTRVVLQSVLPPL